MECWSDVLSCTTPLLLLKLSLKRGKLRQAFTAGLGFAVVTRW